MGWWNCRFWGYLFYQGDLICISTRQNSFALLGEKDRSISSKLYLILQISLNLVFCRFAMMFFFFSVYLPWNLCFSNLKNHTFNWGKTFLSLCLYRDNVIYFLFCFLLQEVRLCIDWTSYFPFMSLNLSLTFSISLSLLYCILSNLFEIFFSLLSIMYLFFREILVGYLKCLSVLYS